MIAVNEQMSGTVDPSNPNTAPLAGSPMGTAPKLKVAIDGPDPEVVASNEARQMAMTRAAREGFGGGGLNGPPTVVPIRDDTGEPLAEEDAFKGATRIKCYRAEYLFITK